MNVTRVEQKMVYLFGLSCSMNALMIFGYGISNYIVLAMMGYKLIVNHGRIRIFKNDSGSKFVLLYFISAALSILTNIGYLPTEWLSNSVKCLVKAMFVFGFFFLPYSQEEIIVLRDCFVRGFFRAAIVHLVWGYLQFILFFFFGFKLNTFIFENLLGMTGYSWDSYVAGNILRMKGLGWETANFALVMIIGYIIAKKEKKRPILIFLFIGAIFLSTSRSGYIAFAAVLLVEMVIGFTNLKQSSTKTSRKSVAANLAALLLIMAIACLLSDEILNRIQMIISSLTAITDISNVNSSHSIHISYYLNLPQILKEGGILRVLFGHGYYSVGYVYSEFSAHLAYRLSLIGWNPESDAITLLVGNGLFGFILYYGFAFMAFLKHRKDEFGLIMVAVAGLGIMYLTIRGTWSFLLIVFALYGGGIRWIIEE